MKNACTCGHTDAQHLHKTQVCRVAQCPCERFIDRDRATDMAPIKPRCKLTGTEGNVFAIIGLVSMTLKRAGQHDRAKEFVEKATSASSYQEVIGKIIHEYVNVS